MYTKMALIVLISGSSVQAMQLATQVESKTQAAVAIDQTQQAQSTTVVPETPKPKIVDNAQTRLAGQKKVKPASLFTRALTKVCDECYGQGANVLSELQRGELRHSGEPGSEIRRIDRGLNDFCKSGHFRGIREILTLASEKGIQPSADTQERIRESLDTLKKKFIKDVFLQVMAVVNDFEVMQDCEKQMKKESVKQSQLELLNFLHAEMLKEYELERKKVAEKEKKTSSGTA